MSTLFDQYKKSYEDAINDAIGFSGLKVDFFTRAKAEDLLRSLAGLGLQLPAVRLLDIGCGRGLIHPWLQPCLGEITGVDVAAEQIEEAQKAQPQNTYLPYDGETLPFEADRFDVTLAICVVHHVPPAQWPAFFQEMQRVTRPGGFVVIYEHNPFNPLTRLAVWRCPFDEDAVLLAPSKLKSLYQAAALEQIKQHFLLFSPFRWKFLLALERRFSWCPLGAQYATFGRKALSFQEEKPRV